MPIKIKTKTVSVIEYSELEQFLTQYFNREIVLEPPMNDVLTEYDVKPFDPLNSYDSKYSIPDYAKYKKDTSLLFLSTSDLHTLLNDLCTDNLLASGNYFVRYSW